MKHPSPRYVVTGGAGFIGSRLTEALNARGEEDILLVDRLGRSEKWRNLTDVRFADYRDRADFLEDVRADRVTPPEAVFHLGACSATTEDDASFLMENNYRYSRSLCEWCLRHGVRFIYASSAATYGDGGLGYKDDEATVRRCRPLNRYALSKQVFDLWALNSGALQHCAGLKYFNVYGPGESHKGAMRSMVHKAYEQLRNDGRIRLFKSTHPDYSDGGQVRDFIYVRDAVAVTLYFHDHPRVSGLFNCGTGCARSWNDLARAVCAACDCPPAIEYIEMPAALRSAYQNHTQADISKLRTAGYLEPMTSLEEGVGDYVGRLRAQDGRA